MLFFIPIATNLKTNAVYSIFENRKYKTVPVFSEQGLLQGDYLPQWEKYFSDHVIGRNIILKACVNIDMNLLHKTVVNHVVIQSDVLLSYHDTDHFDPVTIDKSVKHMSDELSELNEYIKKQGAQFYYVGVAEQYSALADKYPSYLASEREKITYIEDKFFASLSQKNIEYIDMHDIMLKGGNIDAKYSKLDHHYNIFGAYDTYYNIINKINSKGSYKLQPLKQQELVLEQINKEVLGSRNRKLYNFYKNDEKFYVAYPKKTVQFIRMDNGKEVEANTFTMPSQTNPFVEYSNYMGGDVAQTVIDTNRPQLPTVLIFGDSFTNALETIIYYNFDKMYALDLRYYTQDNLYDYIDKVKPDIVLCVRDNTCYLSTDGNGKFH